jgi:drug/metabolite transporter (DMT)-like permease
MLGQQKLYLPIKHIGIALLIGLVNGLGMYFYTKIISTSQPGLYVSVVSASMPILALALGFLIMGQPTITLTKIIGMVVVVAGILLIVK